MTNSEQHAALAWPPNHPPVEFGGVHEAMKVAVEGSRLYRGYAFVWNQPRHAKADNGAFQGYESGVPMHREHALRVLRIMTTDPTASPLNRCIARTILTDIGEWPPQAGEEEQAG